MHLLLRIKIKTHAFQSAEMRRNENAATYWASQGIPGASEAREMLHNIRTGDLRKQARAANLAYGFLLGRSYWQMERTCHEAPDFKQMRIIAAAFTGDDDYVFQQRFANWHYEACSYLDRVPPMSTAQPKPAELPKPVLRLERVTLIPLHNVLVNAVMQALTHGGAHV